MRRLTVLLIAAQLASCSKPTTSASAQHIPSESTSLEAHHGPQAVESMPEHPSSLEARVQALEVEVRGLRAMKASIDCIRDTEAQLHACEATCQGAWPYNPELDTQRPELVRCFDNCDDNFNPEMRCEE